MPEMDLMGSHLQLYQTAPPPTPTPTPTPTRETEARDGPLPLQGKLRLKTMS